jgi:hypothetical protein
MQKQHTAESRSPQVSSSSPQVSSTTSADNTRRERARQKFRFLAAVKFKLSNDSGHKMREDHEVSHHLAADIANEIANSRHNSSVARLCRFAHCKYCGGRAL